MLLSRCVVALLVGASLVPVGTGSAVPIRTGSAESIGSEPLLASGSTACFRANGYAGQAVVADLAVVQPQARGYGTIAAYNDSVSGETASITFDAGINTSNSTIFAADAANGGGCVYSSADTHVVVDVAAYLEAEAATTIEPIRLLDTRTASDVTGGQQIRAGQVVRFDVDVPAGDGLIMDVSAIKPNRDKTFVHVFPCSLDESLIGTKATVNADAGQNVTNGVVIASGGDAGQCAYSSGPVHLTVDLKGSMPSVENGGGFSPVTVGRLLDTRLEDEGIDTFRGDDTQCFTLNVEGLDRVNSDDALIVNVAAVQPLGNGFLNVTRQVGESDDVFDARVRKTAKLTYTEGRNSSNSILVPVSPAGGPGGVRFCVYTSAKTHLVLDAEGLLSGDMIDWADGYAQRLADTRPGSGAPAVTPTPGEVPEGEPPPPPPPAAPFLRLVSGDEALDGTLTLRCDIERTSLNYPNGASILRMRVSGLVPNTLGFFNANGSRIYTTLTIDDPDGPTTFPIEVNQVRSPDETGTETRVVDDSGIREQVAGTLLLQVDHPDSDGTAPPSPNPFPGPPPGPVDLTAEFEFGNIGCDDLPS